MRANSPAKSLSLAFAVTILVGGLLLMLPVARSGAPAWPTSGVANVYYPVAGPQLGTGAPLSVAFFTATSATSVTGLVVVDTGSYWSVFGQIVIGLLMQIGGMGTMTLATLLGMALTRKLGLHNRLNASRAVGALNLSDVRRVLILALKITLLTELMVFVTSFSRFYFGYEYGLGKSVGHAAFLAVSSFNNAGFYLHADSLTSYNNDPFILVAVMAAIVIGGLGYPVLAELYRNRSKHFSILATIMVRGTIALIVVGWALILINEWHNPDTLGPMGIGQKFLVALFSSVTPRTAGFNVIDMAGMDSSSLFVTDILMFVGGGSAGTAGGVKISTVAVIAAVIWAEVRGHRNVNIARRQLDPAVYRQALAILGISLILVVGFTLVLQAVTHHTLEESIFEVISAFSTVGLSVGITPTLPVSMQTMLMILMFMGRVGPLTLATALALRTRPLGWEYPKERPLIG